jgi:hypothetical protein
LWQNASGIAPAKYGLHPILCHKRGDSANLALYSVLKVRNVG